jgi:hypothetical protein
MTTDVHAPPVAPADLYGVMAEFTSPGQILRAARAAHDAGYRSIDAYTPLPVHGLPQALGQIPTKLPWVTFLGGVLGGALGYGLQYWTAVIDYPLNVGGRPLHSWPAFLPVTFELTVLGAALFTVFGMLALNGLPMPYHPVFNAPEFLRATSDRFFLCIRSADPKFDRDAAREFLQSLDPVSIVEVRR